MRSRGGRPPLRAALRLHHGHALLGVGVHHCGWYANIFDATVLLLIAAGLNLLARDRSLAAGVVFGAAFFCKETAILHGAVTTYRDHQRFQRTYLRIYRTAREAPEKPLRIHYPMKPLRDTVRGIEIGDHPDAPVMIAPGDGRLLFR